MKKRNKFADIMFAMGLAILWAMCFGVALGGCRVMYKLITSVL